MAIIAPYKPAGLESPHLPANRVQTGKNAIWFIPHHGQQRLVVNLRVNMPYKNNLIG